MHEKNVGENASIILSSSHHYTAEYHVICVCFENATSRVNDNIISRDNITFVTYILLMFTSDFVTAPECL